MLDHLKTILIIGLSVFLLLWAFDQESKYPEGVSFMCIKGILYKDMQDIKEAVLNADDKPVRCDNE